mgnify:CR=1 FL=1
MKNVSLGLANLVSKQTNGNSHQDEEVATYQDVEISHDTPTKMNLRDKGLKEAGIHHGDPDTLRYLLEQIKSGQIIDENFDDEKECKTHLLNFRNGSYDLKNNEFRQRTQKDSVSIYMDYDYEPSEEEDINKIKQIIKNGKIHGRESSRNDVRRDETGFDQAGKGLAKCSEIPR